MLKKKNNFIFCLVGIILLFFVGGANSFANELTSAPEISNELVVGPVEKNNEIQPYAVKPPTRIWMTETRTFSFPPSAIYTGWKHYTGYYYRGYLGLRDYNYVPGNAYVFEGWLYRSDLPYPIPSIAPIDDLQGNLIGSEFNE